MTQHGQRYAWKRVSYHNTYEEASAAASSISRKHDKVKVARVGRGGALFAVKVGKAVGKVKRT